MTKQYCKHPFETIQIQNNGEIYPCCCSWTDFYSFGNIFQQSFDEIWNGEKAQEFRRQFIDGNYKYCLLDHCWPPLKEFKPELIVDYPTMIEFSYDWYCNVKCLFCRSDVGVRGMNSNEKFLEKFDDTIIPMLKNAEKVYLNSGGELFASKHSMDLVKRISQTYEHIRFDIISNGILFDEKHIQQLGIKNRIDSAVISMHSATKETYNKLVKGGNFDKVMKNVRYLADLKKQGGLSYLQLNFVINSLNYMDIKKFAQIAIDLNAKAFFIEPHERQEAGFSMDKIDVTKKDHPEHKKFAEIFKDPVFDSPNCEINSSLHSLR